MATAQGLRMKNPAHPGGFVKSEIIEALGLSVTDAAHALGVTRPALSAFMNERAHLSPEMALRIEQGRAKRAFEDMTIEAVLAPGQILLISTLPARSGTVGHRFFTQHSEGRLEQKLLVLRLAQTQHDELTSPPEPLQLDAVAP